MTLKPEPSVLLAVPKPTGDRRSTAGAGAASAASDTTLDEERREVVAGVLEALAGNSPDPDEMAACGYLLRHLSRTLIHYGPRAA